MLTSSDFWIGLWDILEQARGEENRLYSLLSGEPKIIVVSFATAFKKAMSNLYDFVGSVTEDMKKDIAAHVVSRGKLYYDEILRDPTHMPVNVTTEDICFFGVAEQVFRDRFGKEMEYLF